MIQTQIEGFKAELKFQSQKALDEKEHRPLREKIYGNISQNIKGFRQLQVKSVKRKGQAWKKKKKLNGS